MSTAIEIREPAVKKPEVTKRVEVWTGGSGNHDHRKFPAFPMRS
jgi:hypothetical protein